MSIKHVIVAALGDSITAGTPLWDPDPTVRATEIGARANPASQWTYWARRATHGMEFVNHGVNREETTEIAARLQAATTGAHVLVIQGGVNDLVHGKGLQETVENLAQMLDSGKDLGLKVAIAELIPNNNFPDLDDSIRLLNSRIREIGYEKTVPVLPFYEVLEDPSRPNRIHPTLTDDGNHPSVQGHRQLGYVVASFLSSQQERNAPQHERTDT